MAIDTKPKRASVIGVCMPMRYPGVDPDVTKGLAWRAAVAHIYNGVGVSGAGQPLMMRWGGSIWPPPGVMRWGRGW